MKRVEVVIKSKELDGKKLYDVFTNSYLVQANIEHLGIAESLKKRIEKALE
jgi:hypothetical protein